MKTMKTMLAACAAMAMAQAGGYTLWWDKGVGEEAMTSSYWKGWWNNGWQHKLPDEGDTIALNDGNALTLREGDALKVASVEIGQGKAFDDGGNTVYMTGGTLEITGDGYLGAEGTGKGYWHQTGGTVVLGNGKSWCVGGGGYGKMTLGGTGRLVTENGHVYAGPWWSNNYAGGGTGDMEVTSGGEVVTRNFIFSEGSTLTFAGGKVTVDSKDGNLFQGNGEVFAGDGGIIIDTGALDISLGKPLLAAEGATSGGLVKNGSGILRMATGNTWKPGIITINEGEVVAYAPDALPIAVLDGVGQITLAEGAKLSLGAGWSIAEVDALRELETVQGEIEHTVSLDEGHVTVASDLSGEDTELYNPKTGAYTLTLTGENDFGGKLVVAQGILAADFGQGIAETDNLQLCQEDVNHSASFAPLSGKVTQNIGDGEGEISILEGATAGFSAVVPTDVTLFNDVDRRITFGANGGNIPSAKFLLNGLYATSDIHFLNPINLNGASTTLDLYVNSTEGDAWLDGTFAYFNADGTLAADHGTFGKNGAGRLVMPPTVSFNQLYASGGTLSFRENSAVALGLVRAQGGAIEFESGANVSVSNDGITSSSGSVLFDNAKVTLSKGDFAVSGSGKITVKGGTFTDTSGGWLKAEGNGEMVFTDGAEVGISPEIHIGYQSKDTPTSSLTVTGGATLRPRLLGIDSGILNIAGEDTLIDLSGDGAHLWMGSTAYQRGTGEVNMTGGTIYEPNSDISIGRRQGATCIFRISGGKIVLGNGKSLVVGDYSNGYLYVDGTGIVDTSDANGIALNTHWNKIGDSDVYSETALLMMRGGEVKAKKVYAASANRDDTSVAFDGGRLTLLSNETPAFNNVKKLYVGVNGGEINTSGYSTRSYGAFAALTNQTDTTAAQIPADYASVPAFVKSGEGTFTLVGENTYACATEVREGTLALQAGTSLPEDQIVRLEGGVLDLGGNTQKVKAIVGTGTVKNGTIIATDGIYPGGAGTVGTLDFDGAAFKGKVVVDASGDASDLVRISGMEAFDLDGVSFELADPDSFDARSITILSAPKIAGTVVFTNLPGRYRARSTGSSVKVGLSGFVIIIR